MLDSATVLVAVLAPVVPGSPVIPDNPCPPPVAEVLPAEPELCEVPVVLGASVVPTVETLPVPVAGDWDTAPELLAGLVDPVEAVEPVAPTEPVDPVVSVAPVSLVAPVEPPGTALVPVAPVAPLAAGEPPVCVPGVCEPVAGTPEVAVEPAAVLVDVGTETVTPHPVQTSKDTKRIKSKDRRDT